MQGLGAVRNVASRMCFPVHPAQRMYRAQRSLRHSTMAVVAAPEKVDSGHVPPFQAWTTGAAIKKREDIKSILLLGAGPIVIGQVRLGLLSAHALGASVPSVTLCAIAGCRVRLLWNASMQSPQVSRITSLICMRMPLIDIVLVV